MQYDLCVSGLIYSRAEILDYFAKVTYSKLNTCSETLGTFHTYICIIHFDINLTNSRETFCFHLERQFSSAWLT